MSLLNILLLIFILMLIGVLPNWPYSQKWGYFPSGGVGLVALVLLVLIFSR